MKIGSVTILSALTVLALWTSPAIAKKPRQIAASAQTQFGLEMYTLMSEQDKSSNLFFSPLSVCTALAMTYAGSKGETSQQMAKVLHYPHRRRVVMHGHRSLLKRLEVRYGNDVTLHMTNRIYTSRWLRLRKQYSKYMHRIFGSRVAHAPFSRPKMAAKMINSRVKQDTNGMIEQLIAPSMLNAATRLVLVNAMYFKGAWTYPFDPEITSTGTFHAPDGERQVEMMRTREMYAFGRAPALKSRVLLMPYKGNKIYMVIVLPNKRTGLAALEAGLAETSLSQVVQKAKVTRKIDVTMPKFKLAEQIDLKQVLTAMGITDLFDSSKADLSRIARGGKLYATDAIHKAVIEVNEEGSEAAAATGISIGFRRAGPRPPPFMVDRPFFFALYDADTDLTLFMGRVVDPTL